jgi:hypothetical protein
MKKLSVQILTIAMMFTLSVSASLAQTRITFKRGKSSATVSGKLSAGASRIYVVNAGKVKF